MIKGIFIKRKLKAFKIVKYRVHKREGMKAYLYNPYFE